MSAPPFIFVSAVEPSGDVIAADFIRELKHRHPDWRIEGMTGPAMREAGCLTWRDVSECSVMGLFEVVRHLPRLLRLRRDLKQKLLIERPNVFVGVDGPDFNLPVAAFLKTRGIHTVQYNSPTVWAWRPQRVHTVAKAVDEVLCQFPFEPACYQSTSVKATYVGHPMADRIPLTRDVFAARKKWGLEPHQRLLALLPGSRSSELQYNAPVFLQTAERLQQKDPDLKVHVSMPNEMRHVQIKAIAKKVTPSLNWDSSVRETDALLAAADVALVGHGTATLQALLHGCPMVTAYALSSWTYFFLKRCVRLSSAALPNILANEPWVPEFLQDHMKPESLAEALQHYLDYPEAVLAFQEKANEIHQQLRLHSAIKTAEALAHWAQL